MDEYPEGTMLWHMAKLKAEWRVLWHSLTEPFRDTDYTARGWIALTLWTLFMAAVAVLVSLASSPHHG